MYLFSRRGKDPNVSIGVRSENSFTSLVPDVCCQNILDPIDITPSGDLL